MNLLNYCMFDLFYMPKLLKIQYIINLFKGMMPIWITFFNVAFSLSC